MARLRTNASARPMAWLGLVALVIGLFCSAPPGSEQMSICVARTLTMSPDDPSRDRFLWHREGRWRRLEPDPRVLEIEARLRETHLIWNPEVQRWLRLAAFGTPSGRAMAQEHLAKFLEADAIEAMRFPDPFRPYGPPELLSQGDLHFLDQVDGVPWLEPSDALLTGTVIAGTQGGGKTRLIISILRQLVTASPPRRVFILDPKGELTAYANYLNATALDGRQIALDLAPPPGLDYPTWLRELTPQLGGTIGVIYGVEILEEAAELALAQLSAYRRQTGRPAELSLQDICVALPFVRDVSRGRRLGYLEAAQTGLKRILDGSGEMFTCRRGIPLQDLFSRNVILDLRHMTDELACRWLVQYILYYRFQEARRRPPTTRLETLIVVDDAQRYISKRSWSAHDADAPTPLAHVLAVLRSSGTGLLVSSQLPAAVDPSVLALSNLLLVVGGIHGLEHQQVMARMMSLDREKQAALGQLVTREAVGLYTRGAYRRPVHGWVPEVPDP